MSKLVLDVLRLLDLIDSRFAPADLFKIADSQLTGAIEYYCRVILDDAGKPQLSPLGSGPLPVLRASMSAHNAPHAIIPSAIVYSSVAVDDPIIEWANPLGTDHKPAYIRQKNGRYEVNNFDRAELRSLLRRIADLAPLVLNGYVQIRPIRKMLQIARQPRVIGFPSGSDSSIVTGLRVDGSSIFPVNLPLRDQVPPALYQSVHDSAIVFDRDGTVPQREDGKRPVAPVSQVGVRFDADFGVVQFGYIDGETVVESGSRASSKVPLPDEFQRWTEECVNRAFIDRMTWVAAESAMALGQGLHYLTESPFERQVLGAAADTSQADAVRFIQSNALSLRVDSADIVLRLKGENEERLARFQKSLGDAADSLAGAGDNFDIEAKKYYDEMIAPEIADLQVKFDKVIYSSSAGAVMGVASVGLAIATGMALPFIGALSMTGVYTYSAAAEHIPEYLAKRRGPAYIWNQISVK